MYDDPDTLRENVDPFVMDMVVSKANNRKMFMHADFEAVCSKYWQLLREQPGADRSTNIVTKDQYCALMKRVYKVLLPLYREEHMAREVAQEWIYDARGASEMNLALFTKALFRVAHSWATHIDLDEYIEVLEKVYERITFKQIIRGATGKTEVAIPRIQVEIFQEKEEEDIAEWISCRSDEFQDESYEYMHKEDPNNPGTTKRYRRPIPDGINEDDGGVMMSVREPFFFKEEVQYYREAAVGAAKKATKPPTERDIEKDLLADMADIYPLGYPTEQFICKLKNDIVEAFQRLKDERKKAIAEMRRQMFEDGAKMKVDRPPEIQRDPGLLQAQGLPHEEFYTMIDSQNKVRVPTVLRVQDRVYNQLRQLFKEASNIVIRPSFDYPARAVIKGSSPPKILGSHDPTTSINETMYNPALERRLAYKTMPCEMGEAVRTMIVNINYLIVDPMYETAYRSDVTRIETAGKMNLRPSPEGEIEQPAEFCNVITPFQKTVQIMLSQKFQYFWTAKVSEKQEPMEKQRDQKTFEYEMQRKAGAILKDSLTAKNLTENYDEKNYLKLMKGPFYNLISKEGSRLEDYVDSTKDVLDYATAELMKVLILGKPRSGKSTLAKSLAERLDLVLVSPHVWLDDLFARIKDREENPPEEDEEDPAAEEEPPAEEAKEGEEEGQKESDEPELDENGNPIVKEAAAKEPEVPKRDKKDMWLTELEYQVRNTLRAGQHLGVDQMDEIVVEMINSPQARTKGFVLDLCFAKNEDEVQWGIRLVDKDILTNVNEPTHIIELLADDDEVRRRAKGILKHPVSGIPYSAWERAERNRPKQPKLDENGEAIESEAEENEEELIAAGLKGPLEDSKMVQRSCDAPSKLDAEIEYYSMRERNYFDEFIIKMHDSTYLKVDIAGLTPAELTETVVVRLKPNQDEPLRPVAHIIEDGAGSFKELLTAGMEDTEGLQLPRTWSLWKTIDPVSLFNGKVETGSAEFAAHYANAVFVFQNEENLKAFVKEPRLYIDQAPQMPPGFRLMMLGPRGIGVRKQSQLLEDLYGWRVVDFKAIVQEKLREILSLPQKPPNNVTDIGPCMVSMSEQELMDIKEGKPMPSWKFLPWIIEYLGIPLEVKEKPPPEEDSVTDEEWDEQRLKQHKDKIKKKKKELEAAQKAATEATAAKAERAQRRKEALEQNLNLEELGLQESEEEIIIEDVPIDHLIIQKNDDGTLPPIDSFILIGFPQTETHCQKLKEYNIDFDRVLFLTEEENEEEPGKEVTTRMTEKESLAYDWAAELEVANALKAVVQEHVLGEEGGEKLMEIRDCTGSVDEVHFKIRSRLDPFFTRPDDTTDDIKVTADYEEEELHRVPKSDFGDYCPVTYVDDNFIVKGGSDEDGGEAAELYVHGKRYFFAGQKEVDKFRKDPERYMLVQERGAEVLPLTPPPPKIMITGTKCAGVTTQITRLCEKFKLDSLELYNSFTERQAEELKARQRKRLLDRGFKGFPVPEDGEDPEVDTEVIEDPEDFDKAEQDIKDLKTVIAAKKGLIIDGNWRPAGEDADYALPDLLKNSRRMPEIVVVLKCKEDVSVKRNLADIEDDLKTEYEQKMDKREADRVKAREDARKEKEQELEEAEQDEMTPEEIAAKKKEAMQEWEDARDEQEKEEDENDEDKPDLEKMKEERAEAIKAMCESDETNLEALKTKLVEEWKAVEVVELETSKISAEFVHIKLLNLLKKHIAFRKDMIERAQAIAVKPAEVKVYESSYTYKHSKFGLNSPLSPYNPRKTKEHAVLYRERLYFLASADEQEKFLLEPSKYVMGVEVVPLDVKILPRVVVQGLPKSGKTELCERIQAITGAVHLKMEEVIESFVDRDSSFADKVVTKLKGQGRDLDDLMLVQLIQKRVERADCVSKGWVLEGFPQTRNQAILMAKKSLLPSTVLMLNVPLEEVYKRTAPLAESDFGCDRVILRRRLAHISQHIPQMAFFFQKFYDNVTQVDALKSKWYMQEVAVSTIQANITARMNFARDYQHVNTVRERPCPVEDLNMDRIYFKQSISQFGHFCPVSWLNEKRFVSCTHQPELCVLYKNLFYYFAGKAHRDLFIRNPKKFAENVIFSQERNIPKRVVAMKAAEVAETEKALEDYCPVTLQDEEKLVKGSPLLVVNFKGEKFTLCSEEKLHKFITTPSRYARVSLPVRIPPKDKPLLLATLKGQDNSITFLEQALGSVVTKGLREIGEQRLKYPTLTVKETMLKLFAIFLKTENPANTEHMKKKYMEKMRKFLEKCTVPQELADLAEEKEKKQKKGKWPAFKEKYYNELGQQYDKILTDVEKEKAEGFWNYMK